MFCRLCGEGEGMIKRVTTILRAKSSEEWERLCELLRRVGFAEGKKWDRAVSDGRRSRGTPFEAPVAQVEVTHGEYMAELPELFVEVSELGSVEEVVRAWSREVAASGRGEELAAEGSQVGVGKDGQDARRHHRLEAGATKSERQDRSPACTSIISGLSRGGLWKK